MSKNKKVKQKQKRQAPVIESLEPRILLSADFPGLDLPDIDPNDPLDADVDSILAHAEEAFLAAAAEADAAASESAQELAVVVPTEEPEVLLPSSELPDDARRELIIVDPNVPDYELLLAGVNAVGSGDTRLDVVMLDPQRSGIDQISEILASRSGLGAIHLISHGDDGAIRIGGDTLDLALLQSEPEAISGWGGALSEEGGALSEEGDILIYGCNVAETEAGQVLIDTLAEMTRADVAASSDLTGHASLGGDWDLEYQSGQIEAELVVTEDAQGNFEHVLVTANLQPTQDTYIALKEDTTNYGADGIMVVDRESTDLQRALLQFDFSSIPAGAVVTSATLKLDATAVGGQLNISVYELLESWVEGTATWGERDSGTSWATAGGEYDPVAVDNLNTSATGQHTWDVTGLVQGWISGATINNGLMVASPDGGGNRTATYASSEGGTQPVLTVDYTLPNSPVITSDGGGAAVTLEVPEDTTAVTTVTATDPNLDIVTFSISGGADQTRFTINPTTGVLEFTAAPDYESPSDADTDNVYQVEVTADDGNGNTDTQLISVAVTNVDDPGINDAPANSLPGSQAIDQDGMLLFASATGTAISVSDLDAGSDPIQVTLTATNGTLNLSGFKGLTFSVGDGTADATMTFTGSVADINAALEGATFVATPGFTGAASVQITTDDLGNTGSGGALSDTDSLAITVQAADQRLWLTFAKDEDPTGNSDIPSITGGDVVTFGDITQLETSNSNPLASTTSGTMAYGFNLDTVLLSGGGAASDGDAIVNAVHHVGRDIQVGTNAIQLYAGDLLLSTDGAEDIGLETYEKEDVFVFRPDTPGDYSQGSFFRLIDGKNDTGWGNVSGISLVEQTTVVGGVTLNAGEILVAHDSSKNNILRFTPGTLGDTTTGITSILIAGADIDIDKGVGGVHLVQADTEIGGRSLTAGQLLVSSLGDDSAVGNGTAINILRHDIFVLNVTATGTGTSVATADRFFEGLDEDLDNGNEAIWGIGYQGNSVPTVNGDTKALDENSANGSVVANVNAADAENGTLRYAITAGNTDGAFAIDATTGQITVANSAALDFETTPTFNLTVAAIDPEGAYDTATMTVNLNDLVENTAPTLSLNNVIVSLSEGTDTTSAIKIADIVISDDGFGTNDLSLAGADAASFEIVGTELRLKAGAVLDFEGNPGLDVTVQVDDSSVGGTPDDSVAVAVTVTDANDAPVLDNSGDTSLTSIFENQANSTGTLVSDLIASAGGDRITDQDGDPEGIAITAVDDSNGTWQYSADGGSNWFDVGSVSDGSALLLSATATDLIRFVPNTAFNGTAGISFRAWDTTDGSVSGDTGVDVTGNGGSTAYSAASESADITVAPVDIKLYFSTIDSQVGAGTPGAESWDRGDVVAIGDPGFALEADGAKDGSAESSGGTLYDATQGFLSAANTANSDTLGDVRISAMHYVGEDIAVGNAPSTINLLAGDLLLSVTHASATFQGSDLGSVTVGHDDVFVFRPDAPGDYRSGSFELLFADPAGNGGNLTGISLVETDVMVGQGGGRTDLAAGTLVYSTDGAPGNNIYYFEPDQVGAGTSAAGSGLLIEGDDIGLGASGGGNAITGLSLIKQDVVADGVTLDEGTLLVSLQNDDGAVGNIGATAAGTRNDIYAIAADVTGATTTAEATLLYDGSDLGLNASGGAFNALSVLIDTTGGKKDPSINLGGGSLDFTEDDGATVIAPGISVSDNDSIDFAGGQLRVDITSNATVNDRLGIQHTGSGTGEVGVVGDLVQYEGITVGNLSGGVGAVPLTITFNSNATETIVGAVAQAVTYDNVSGDPSELTRTVQYQVTDGDGGTSNLGSKNITVTAVNDNPTITSAATASVAENSMAVLTVTASDPELDPFSYAITGGADAAFFAIDSATGALSFRDAPDFEGAADADGNNSYLVEVTARDGSGNEGSMLVTVSVTDVNEGPEAADWYDPNWGQRKAVTVDAAQVAGSLRDFPVLISIAADADLAARALASGDDILFTGADGTTKLAHEIESFNDATGELRVWVKTDLSAGQDTVLYLYYGNASATPQQDPTNVWDGDFVGVWHLDEAPDGNAGTDEILDSTANAQHGNTEGAIDATDLVTAKIGEGIDFDSVDASLIRIADSAALDTTANGGTFELWINYDNAADGDHQIVMSSSNRYAGGANDGFEWASQGSGDHFFYPWGGDNNDYNIGPNPFTNGQWHHLAVSYDFDQQDASIFVDGVEMAYSNEWVSTNWDTLANPADWLWGGNPDRGSRYFDGMMDEIRVSNVDRSLAWIQTSYANQWDTAGFASIGSEETRALTVAEDAANDATVGFAHGFDDDADALTYAITGGNVGNAFKINAATGEIQVNDASAIDYETLSSYALNVLVTDPEGETDTATVAIEITDVNEAPTVSLVNPTNDIDENTDTSSAIRIADIVVDDDALGTNTLSLTGADAGSFEMVGNELRLKAGTVLDYETQSSYDVSVQVDDAGVGATPDDTAVHPFNVTDVNEAPLIGGDSSGAVTEDFGVLGGNLSTAGTLTIVDQDVGDSQFVAGTVSGTYGSLIVDSAGNWTYTADNSQAVIQQLGEGDSLVDTLTLSTADGTNHDVVITINGSNDIAVANPDAYSLNEDGSLTVDWWDNDWTRRQELTFDNLTQSETLTDFPVLIVLNSSNIDYALTSNDGSDLRFFAADGTPLAYQVEEWNESGDSSVWVRVPQITGSSNTDSITMYYGNTAADPVNNGSAVWDDDFVGVWHLNEEQAGTGNGGVYQNATGQDHDGIDRVAATGQEGQVTDGQEFGANDWIEIDHDPSLDLKDSMTISFWIKPTSDSGSFNRVVEKGLWGYNDSYYFGGGNGTNDLTFYLNGQGVIDTPDDVLTVGVWQHAAVSYTSNGDGTGTARLYLNGVEIATGNYTNGAVDGNSGRLTIGHEDTAYDFDGFIDEVQISKIDRSADWITAHYQATRNEFGSEFVQFGGAEVAPVIDGVNTNDTDADNDRLTASIVSGPSNAAAFTFNKDGTFSYTPNADFAGTDTFTYKVNDGTADSNTQTVTITVDPVNDAPVRTAGTVSNLTVNEDSGFTSLGLGGVTYSPGGGADESGQTLSYQVTAIPSVAVGDIFLADGTTRVTTGAYTLAQIQGMQFKPADNATGTTAFQFNVTDSGGTANGGVDGTSQFILITIDPVNDAPTLTSIDGDVLSYAEGDGAVILDQSVNALITDVDSADFAGGELNIECDSGLQAGEDVFAIRNQGASAGQIGVSGSDVTYGGVVIGTFSGGTGLAPLNIVFNGNATTAAVTALVQNFTYENTNNDNPTQGARNITIDLNDGDGGAIVTQNMTINVSAVNDDPINEGSLPTDVTVTEDVSSFIDLSSFSLADVDAGNGLLTITLSTDTGGRLWASSDFDVIVLGSGTGTLQLQGGVADLNNFFSSATRFSYLHGTAHTNGDNADTIQIQVSDGGNTGSGGGGLIDLGTVNVDITAVNDTPLNSVPGAQTTPEDTPLVFSAGNSNAISISDVDAAVSDVAVRLVTTNGTVSLSGTIGLAFSTGDGSADAEMLFSGTVAAINAALEGLTFTPTADFDGVASIQIITNDSGNTGSGGAKEDSDTIAITVTAGNDAPTVESTIADQNLNEDFASYTIDLNAAFADVETADGALVYGVSGNTNINVSIASGIATITPTADWNGSESLTFTATDAGGLSVSQVVGFAVTAVADIADDAAVAVVEDTATIITVLGNDSFEGTPVVTATSSPANGAVVINGDNTITYTPNSNYTGADSFTYTVTSGGMIETATVSLNVTPVNDAPTIGGIDVGAVAEDTDPDLDTLLETAGALTIADPDAGESSFVAGTVAGTHGHLIIDAFGNWDYEVDNTQASIQQLDAGESINDVLTVTTADGTTHDITVTINGAEDAPVIAGSITASVTEDGALTATGSLTITDADTSDNPVRFPDEASTPGDNGYGEFQLIAGNWSYALDNAHAAVQALGAGASLTDTHTFMASDGSTQVVSIVIAGAAEAVPPPIVEPPVPEPEPEPIQRITPPSETEDRVEPPAEEDPAPESAPLTGATDPSIAEPESEDSPASALSSRFPEPLEPGEIFLEILADSRPHDVSAVKQAAVVAKPTAENAQTFLQELKSFWKEDSTTASIEMSEVHLSKEFWNGLDKMAQDLDESIEEQDKHNQLSAEAAAGVSISLTAGFVSWAMRAGSMAASLLAAMPTWRHFDPMPVLSADEKKKQAPAATDDADEETREMAKNERIERLFGGD